MAGHRQLAAGGRSGAAPQSRRRGAGAEFASGHVRETTTPTSRKEGHLVLRGGVDRANTEMGFKKREKRRRKKAAQSAAQKQSRRTGSSATKWWLTPVKLNTCCA